MPSKDPQERSLDAAFAAASRWGNLPPDIAVRKRDLKADKLAAHIARVVDTLPPLTAEQRDRLALLLRGDAG